MKHDNLLRCNAAAVSSSTKIVASYKPYANIKCCPQLIWPDRTTDAAACAGFDGPRAINLNISGIICASCSKEITEVAFRGIENVEIQISYGKSFKILLIFVYLNIYKIKNRKERENNKIVKYSLLVLLFSICRL